jgi:tetratricopeptide (TPR) repeat protein
MTTMRALLCLMLLSSIALAEDDEQVAKIHARAANDYYVKADYDKALKEFQETYRLSKRPQFLYNIAVCHERLGQYQEAVENLEQYLRDLPEASDRGMVEDRIRNLKARLPPKPEKQKPVVVAEKKKRPWWVLGVVGGVVAVGLAVGLGVGLGTGGSDWSPTLGVDPKK